MTCSKNSEPLRKAVVDSWSWRHFGASINHVEFQGEGVNQMTILLHKSYFVRGSMNEEEGVQNNQKSDHVVYGCPLLC